MTQSQPTNGHRMLRPRPARWDLMLCCNEPENGSQRDFVDAIQFGIGRGNFEFGTDWVDEWELTIAGPDITFRWVDMNHFKLGRKTHRCLGTRQWVGNWCWDGCFVTTTTVREVARFCKSRNWSPEDGSTNLWRWWENLK